LTELGLDCVGLDPHRDEFVFKGLSNCPKIRRFLYHRLSPKVQTKCLELFSVTNVKVLDLADIPLSSISLRSLEELHSGMKFESSAAEPILITNPNLKFWKIAGDWDGTSFRKQILEGLPLAQNLEELDVNPNFISADDFEDLFDILVKTNRSLNSFTIPIREASGRQLQAVANYLKSNAGRIEFLTLRIYDGRRSLEDRHDDTAPGQLQILRGLSTNLHLRYLYFWTDFLVERVLNSISSNRDLVEMRFLSKSNDELNRALQPNRKTFQIDCRMSLISKVLSLQMSAFEGNLFNVIFQMSAHELAFP
jgi:hypothetical protein